MPRLVDLSQEIYQGMGVYPGHLKTVIWDHANHSETVKFFDGGFSFHSQGLMMCDHGPTHVDAISHLDPAEGAPSIDEMPLDTFYGPALCIDVSHVEPPEYITVDDLVQALEAAGQVLEPGDALADAHRHVRPLRRHAGLHDALHRASTRTPATGSPSARSRSSGSTPRAPTTRSAAPTRCT